MLNIQRNLRLLLITLSFCLSSHPALANRIISIDKDTNEVRLEIDGEIYTASLEEFKKTSIQEKEKTFIRPLNMQSAFIDTSRKNEIRIDFDWIHNSAKSGDFKFISDNYTLPRINYKRSFNTKLPIRLGIGTSLNLVSSDLEGGNLSPFSFVSREYSELGMGNIVLNFDTSIINQEHLILNLFFDQFLPTQNTGGTFTARDGFGDQYGFQTGIRYQLSFLKYLRLFGDLAYAKYINFNDNLDSSFDSLIYYNELVVDTKRRINLSFGLLGQTIYNNININQLYFVPGVIVPFGKSRNFQARLGVPIGLTEDSSDIGLQASLFTLL